MIDIFEDLINYLFKMKLDNDNN